MILQGKVTSGIGKAAFWIKKIEKAFKEKTGIENLFLGTLNVNLDKPYKLGDSKIIIYKEEFDASQDVFVKPCRINDYPAYIVRSSKNESGKGDHSQTAIEIVADVNLRDRFDLKDEDNVLIYV